MAFDSVFVHSEILKKSFNLEKVKNQIEKNGIIELTKPKLDLFTFISQTIISQQISNKVAQSIWKKFCLLLKTDFPKIEDIRSKKKLSYLLKDIGISNKKKKYIELLYEGINFENVELEKLNEENIRNYLLNFSGIGNWTCDMVQIFYLQRMNIFPETDLVIKKTIKKLCQLEKKKINFKKKFSPYLSIFSLHLWQMSKRIL